MFHRSASGKSRKLLLVSLLAIQQLCFCFWLCLAVHEHAEQAAEAVFQSEALPCGESEHLERCEKSNLLNAQAKADFQVPADLLPPAPREFFIPWLELAKEFEPSNPTGSGPPPKLFLRLNIFRC